MKRHSSGFTLIEVLVALAVIGVGIVVVHEAFSIGLRTVDLASERATGLMLLHEKAQELSREPRQAGETVMGKFDDPFAGYAWEAACEAVPDEDYLALRVKVSWADGRRSVSANTWLGRQG